MANEEDHGRITQSTMNKLPDGTIEFHVVYEDGYSPPMETNQGSPPVQGEIIHSETSFHSDGSTSNFQQFEGGRAQTIVTDNEGNTFIEPGGGSQQEETQQQVETQQQEETLQSEETTEPEKPSQPEESSEPEKPSEPAEPSQPGESEAPAEPSEPDQEEAE